VTTAADAVQFLFHGGLPSAKQQSLTTAVLGRRPFLAHNFSPESRMVCQIYTGDIPPLARGVVIEGLPPISAITVHEVRGVGQPTIRCF